MVALASPEGPAESPPRPVTSLSIREVDCAQPSLSWRATAVARGVTATAACGACRASWRVRGEEREEGEKKGKADVA
ncbi:hypothetical protein U9M48_001367 [Paspalum notatum var. saurae]|uniref:Uncharacterized protein n=1 Tax=Paspalum notatum var. saurae TaxID=547442 RepID=A0AAQ3PP89_PASNO